jgi:hypothetical protein
MKRDMKTVQLRMKRARDEHRLRVLGMGQPASIVTGVKDFLCEAANGPLKVADLRAAVQAIRDSKQRRAQLR